MPVREVFVHHFRLPRRGEEMARFLFRYAFAWQTRTAKGLPLSGSPLSLTDLPGVLKDQIIHIAGGQQIYPRHRASLLSS